MSFTSSPQAARIAFAVPSPTVASVTVSGQSCPVGDGRDRGGARNHDEIKAREVLQNFAQAVGLGGELDREGGPAPDVEPLSFELGGKAVVRLAGTHQDDGSRHDAQPRTAFRMASAP